jgi:hypothetical protein
MTRKADRCNNRFDMSVRYKGGYRGPGFRLLKWYGGAKHPQFVAWFRRPA